MSGEKVSVQVTVSEKDIIQCLKRVRVNGTMRSVAALNDFADQFMRTSSSFDSAAHEVAAIAMRWAANRIAELESRVDRATRELNP